MAVNGDGSQSGGRGVVGSLGIDERARQSDAWRVRKNRLGEIRRIDNVNNLKDEDATLERLRERGLRYKRVDDPNGMLHLYLTRREKNPQTGEMEDVITGSTRPAYPTPEEWATIDAGGRVEPRREGIGYADDGYLSEGEMSRRRQLVYGDNGTGSIKKSARSVGIRNAFFNERKYGNGPTGGQISAQERWRMEREHAKGSRGMLGEQALHRQAKASGELFGRQVSAMEAQGRLTGLRYDPMAAHNGKAFVEQYNRNRRMAALAEERERINNMTMASRMIFGRNGPKTDVERAALAAALGGGGGKDAQSYIKGFPAQQAYFNLLRNVGDGSGGGSGGGGSHLFGM